MHSDDGKKVGKFATNSTRQFERFYYASLLIASFLAALLALLVFLFPVNNTVTSEAHAQAVSAAQIRAESVSV